MCPNSWLVLCIYKHTTEFNKVQNYKQHILWCMNGHAQVSQQQTTASYSCRNVSGKEGFSYIIHVNGCKETMNHTHTHTQNAKDQLPFSIHSFPTGIKSVGFKIVWVHNTPKKKTKTLPRCITGIYMNGEMGTVSMAALVPPFIKKSQSSTVKEWHPLGEGLLKGLAFARCGGIANMEVQQLP